MQVYVITNDVNNKVYVGACSIPLERRWASHRCWAKKGRGYLLHSAMREHGIGKFHVSRVWSGNISRKALKALEEYYIKAFQTLTPNGYNETIGGTTRIFRPCSPEKAKKISASLMGHATSQETRDKISIATRIGMARARVQKQE